MSVSNICFEPDRACERKTRCTTFPATVQQSRCGARMARRRNAPQLSLSSEIRALGSRFLEDGRQHAPSCGSARWRAIPARASRDAATGTRSTCGWWRPTRIRRSGRRVGCACAGDARALNRAVSLTRHGSAVCQRWRSSFEWILTAR